MTLTTSELREVVAMTIMSYLNEVEGRKIAVDECIALVKWVDSHDFEETLEVVKG